MLNFADAEGISAGTPLVPVDDGPLITTSEELTGPVFVAFPPSAVTLHRPQFLGEEAGLRSGQQCAEHGGAEHHPRDHLADHRWLSDQEQQPAHHPADDQDDHDGEEERGGQLR